jgi:hypothetical protein
MSDKLIIHYADGTSVAVEPLKPWTPGELITPADFTAGSLERAMFCCMVRGYIARAAKPNQKYWHNTLDWANLPERLAPWDKLAMDWKDYDPQEDEGPLTA